MTDLEFKYSVSAHGRECEVWVDNYRLCTVTERVPYRESRILLHSTGPFTIAEMSAVVEANQAAMRIAQHWKAFPAEIQRIQIIRHVIASNGIDIALPGMAGTIIEHPYSGVDDMYLVQLDLGIQTPYPFHKDDFELL